jgi:tripartite-type tricarboxylate transporter receptor subunit TctC
VLPHLKSGKLVGLAVASRQRSSLLPDIPTFEEAGVKGYVIDTWFGLLAPAGTPDDVMRVLQREATSFGQSAAVRERLLGAGLEPQTLCGEPFTAQLKREVDANTRLARELNLKAE